MRTACVVFTGLLLTAPLARAGEDSLKGNWTVSFYPPGAHVTLWLVKLEAKDGKLDGTVKPAPRVPESTLADLRVKGKVMTLAIKFSQGGRSFNFEFVVPKAGAKKVHGSVAIESQMFSAELESTKDDTVALKQERTARLDFEEAKELVSKKSTEPKVFDAAGVLFRQAKDNKATAADVKAWRDSLLETAAHYGPRWQNAYPLRLAEALANADGYPEVAEETVRSAIKSIDPKAGAEGELRGLSLLERVLKKAGKTDELKEIAARVSKLEEVGHKEALKDLPFKAMKGERTKGNRAVVVELFTGAMCPPCVAADMAFDGLEKTYAPKDLVLLQYHLHIPGPDALTSPASVAREEYYGDAVQGTPSIIFNGKRAEIQGGPAALAEERYKEYLDVLKPLLANDTKIQLTASAERKGDKIDITASVSGLEKPGNKIRLRLVLVEEWARYQGSNGLSYHSRVVRAMPGGAKGKAVAKDSVSQKATVDLDELRGSLNKYLDGVPRANFTLRPMRFHHLSVVAFVQDDDSKEILQAIDVLVK